MSGAWVAPEAASSGPATETGARPARCASYGTIVIAARTTSTPATRLSPRVTRATEPALAA